VALAEPAKPVETENKEAGKSKKRKAKGGEKTGGNRRATGATRAAGQRAKARRAVRAARAQLGDPYRYGATGPHAFDCSGLTWYAWRRAGVRIPRVAAAQYRGIRRKVSWRHLRPGDLLFFRGLGHVGMYVGEGRWIHAPRSGARVRVERLSLYRKRTFVGAVRPGA
jgi:cell wall-associated NlpC family hydrolase